MDRITEPLKLMKAKFENNANTLPLKILGQDLKNIEYALKLPSAQVKSGLIFAALNTRGKTCIIEKMITRDHTEILLDYFDAEIEIGNTNDKKLIQVVGKKELNAKNITVPSDLPWVVMTCCFWCGSQSLNASYVSHFPSSSKPLA